MWLLGFYFHDDYRLRPNFVLNLGVRYEFLTPYSERRDRFIVVNDLFGTAKLGQHEGWAGRTCSGCVDPRVGFAWELFSNGNTVLKGGYGIFRNQLVHFNGYFQIPSGSPGGLALNGTNPAFPNPTLAIPGAVLNFSPTGTAEGGVKVLPRIPATPSAMHWNLTLDHQMTQNMTVRLGYLGSHGYHLESGYPLNTNTYEDRPDGTRFFAPGVHRIRPNFGPVDLAAYDFNSYYNAFTVTVGRRMTRGLGLEASYAFSRATDDTSVGLSSRGFISSDIRAADGRRNTYHGLSGYDIRNRFVSNLTYDLPSLARSSRVAEKLLRGWQVNTILTLQTRTPLSVWIGFDRANTTANNGGEQQRPSMSPSLRGEIPLCPCPMPSPLGGGTQKAPERYYDPTVFVLPEPGTYGNAGRNIIIGPGLANLDLALEKNTAMTERINLQFRAEGFNLFNRVNWLNPSPRLFETNGSISGSAGRIVGTNTTSRQLQFALKLLF